MVTTQSSIFFKRWFFIGALMIFLILEACQNSSQTNEADQTSEDVEARTSSEETEIDNSFVGLIEKAHKKDDWYAKNALQFDMDLTFNGNQVLEGKVTMRPHAGLSRVELKDGTLLIFDGKEAYLPDTSNYPAAQARFHLLTWPYFLAAPYKFKDPGAKVDTMGAHPLFDTQMPAAKMVFTEAVGDTPDDWYVLYRNPENDRLRGMAYIVTFGTTVEDASAEPHLIAYEDYQDIEGIPVPFTWTFWNWSQEEGEKDQIGEVKISNFSFVEVEDEVFQTPENFKMAELPKAEG